MVPSILCPGQDDDKKGHGFCNILRFLTVCPTENRKIDNLIQTETAGVSLSFTSFHLAAWVNSWTNS